MAASGTSPPSERMTTAEVLDAIARERSRLIAAVDALGDRAATLAVTAEGWTAKDVLTHLVHWAAQTAGGLGEPFEIPPYMAEERRRRQALGIDDGRPPPGDEANALAVAYYRDVPFADVRDRFDRLADAIAVRAGQRSDDAMNATDSVPWAPGRPLWRFIGGDTFLHWPVHSADIERAAAGAVSGE